jgi:hypothetical protein
MPNFFVPFATTPEMAEEAYAGFLRALAPYPLIHPTGRLFKVTFRDEGNLCAAEVAQDLTNWRGEIKGHPILAIIETTQILSIFTRAGAGFSGQILVGREKVVDRTFFDDFP